MVYSDYSVIKFAPFGVLDSSDESVVVKSGFKTSNDAKAYIEAIRFLPEFEGELLGIRVTVRVTDSV